MGFLLRSAFWLGVVFNAMPWGETRLTDVVPAARQRAAGVAIEGRDSEAASAIAGAVLRTALSSRTATAGAAATRAKPAVAAKRASVDTLTAEDRLPPWRGPGAGASAAL